MKLYEINSEIQSIMDTMVDEETGEVNEEALQQLETLNIDRNSKLEWIALCYKNMTADVAKFKAEEKSLANRKKLLERKADRTKAFLQEQLNGEKIKTPRVAVSYRNSQAVEIQDEKMAVAWAEINANDCVEIKKTIKKAEVKKLLQSGKSVDGAILQEKQNMNIK